jgi:hypothetical protein
MVVNDDAGILDERGALACFASELAPTGFGVGPPGIKKGAILTGRTFFISR